ncbi:MAG TPA: hypothetical protein VLA49_18925 [Anaerolineales bacterium]|nr:hypothetical protein [Anaerolineales bacterium]
MTQGTRFEFANEGVTITIPPQSKKAKAQKLSRTSLANMPGVPGGFKPGRVVINFQIVDEDNPTTVLTEFSPKFELRIRYTPADLKRAQDAGEPLQLAYWDGAKWVKFTQEKHNFKLEASAQGKGGFGVAMIGSWGDPNIAWGP